MNNALAYIHNLNDSDFIQYAKYFKRNQLSLQDYVSARDLVKKRCKLLGYEFTTGCCGINKLIKLDDNQK